MAYAMTKQGSLTNFITYEFICDTVADMNAIETEYRTLGSVAIVLTGESGMEVYMAGSDKEWNSLTSLGGGGATPPGLTIYICGQNEVSNGLPNVAEPDETSLYLVPAGEETNNLYEEYVWVNDAWERFGGATLDLSGYATLQDIAGFYTKPNGGIPAADLAETYLTQHQSLDAYAPKANPVFSGDISLGRSSGSTSGSNNIAVGFNVIASGNNTQAFGYQTQATGDNSYTTGYQTAAIGSNSHAEGSLTKAHGNVSHSEGKGNSSTKLVSGLTYTGTGAYGDASHSEGYETFAIGMGSHAEGLNTQAIGQGSHSEGQGGNFQINSLTLTSAASGINAHSEGTYTIASGAQSHSEGQKTQATGASSHAEGELTKSVGLNSHAEGQETQANGTTAHAEGRSTQANGHNSHAEGVNTIASDVNSHAEGNSTQATAAQSHAEGDSTKAMGVASHAEGYGGTFKLHNNNYISQALGMASHTEGYQTQANFGDTPGNHAEGYQTVASGGASHSEGKQTFASGTGSHAEGIGGSFSINNLNYSSIAGGKADHTEGYQCVTSPSTYGGSHAEGYQTRTAGSYTHAEGYQTYAYGDGSHSEGSSTNANGSFSHAEGLSTNSSGTQSHAEGQNTIALGAASHAEGVGGTYTYNNNSYTSAAQGMSDHVEGYQCYTSPGQPGNHAEGYQTRATGGASHAEGHNTAASGSQSHAEGQNTTASGSISHVEGQNTTASGGISHAEGQNTIASGGISHAEGIHTVASGGNSHAEGNDTIASGKGMHVQGSFNIDFDVYPEWTANTSYIIGNKISRFNNGYKCITANSDASFTAAKWEKLPGNTDEQFIIGNGTADNARSNAFAVYWNGDTRTAGDVYVNCNSDSTGGNKLATEAYVASAMPGVASVDDLGLIKVNPVYGLQIISNTPNIAIVPASNTELKAGTNYYKPVVPANIHQAAFYGLAKAAGDTTQSVSNNAVGTYTTDAKTAICTMIGASSSADVAVLEQRVAELESEISSLRNALNLLNVPENVVSGADGTPVTDENLNYVEFDEPTT